MQYHEPMARRKWAKKEIKSGADIRSGKLTINRAKRSGQYLGHNYAEVYRDGKVYVYTPWNDNDEDVGQELDFDKWWKSLRKRG
jgi:hypothetical protein